MLADRAYPDWAVENRLQMARNQFVQGIRSSSIQLSLMKEKPKLLERALELAQTQEAVEIARKRLHAQTAATLSTDNSDAEADNTTNVL